MENQESSWVKRTNQHWKVVLAFGLMVPLGTWVVLFAISATFRLNLHHYLPGFVSGIIILGSVVLAIPGLHLWIHGIKCKACKGRPNLVAFGIFCGSPFFLLIYTTPNRNGVSLAFDYLLRRKEGDLADPPPSEKP